MAFPIDPGRPPGIQPLENLVPDQGNVDPRAMLPLAPAREQQHHDVRQHAGLGHVQHDEDMNLEDMLPLRQAFNLDQDDAMLEDDNNQLREHGEINLLSLKSASSFKCWLYRALVKVYLVGASPGSVLNRSSPSVLYGVVTLTSTDFPSSVLHMCPPGKRVTVLVKVLSIWTDRTSLIRCFAPAYACLPC